MEFKANNLRDAAARSSMAAPPRPLFSIKELVQFFSDTFPNEKVKITSADMLTPTKQTCYAMYRCLLRAIFIDMPDIDQLLLFGSLASDGDPELYREGAGLLYLVLLVRSVEEDAIKMPISLQLTVGDIVNPNPKRTHFHISALVDFYLSAAGSNRRADAIFERYRHHQIERAGLIEKVKQLENRLKRKQHEKLQVEQQKSLKLDQLAKLRGEMETARLLSVDRYEKNVQVESNVKSEDAAMIELEQQISDLQKQSDLLSLNIVSSPDRIIGEVRTINAQTRSLTEEIDQTHAEIGELKKTIERYKCIIDEIDVLVGDIESIAKLRNELSSKDKRHAELEAKLEDLKMQLAVAQKSEQMRMNEKNVRIAAIQRAHEKHLLQMADVENRYLAQHDQRERQQRRLDENEVVADNLQHEIKDSREAVVQMTRQFKVDIEKMNDAYARVYAKYTHANKCLNDQFAIANDHNCGMLELRAQIFTNGNDATDDDEEDDGVDHEDEIDFDEIEQLLKEVVDISSDSD